LENKDKEMTDIKNQQIELKRVELITFQRNIEDKYKLEIEQLKEENKNKISVIRRKNDANLQKALAQQKEELESVIVNNSVQVDTALEEKLKGANDIIKQKKKMKYPN